MTKEKKDSKEKDDIKEQDDIEEQENPEEPAEDEGIESFDLSYFMDEDFFEDGFELKEEAENLISLLCFDLANEEYALDIMKVKEIVKLKEFTEVPRSPEFITGIISLRGIIVPVFDLRKRLGLEAKDYDRDTRIIITTDGAQNWGMIVDSVVHVIKLPEENIEPPPSIISGVSAEFITGVGKYEHKFIIIMNLKNVLDIDI